jgi:hypothetical protein
MRKLFLGLVLAVAALGTLTAASGCRSSGGSHGGSGCNCGH